MRLLFLLPSLILLTAAPAWSATIGCEDKIRDAVLEEAAKARFDVQDVSLNNVYKDSTTWNETYTVRLTVAKGHVDYLVMVHNYEPNVVWPKDCGIFNLTNLMTAKQKVTRSFNEITGLD